MHMQRQVKRKGKSKAKASQKQRQVKSKGKSKAKASQKQRQSQRDKDKAVGRPKKKSAQTLVAQMHSVTNEYWEEKKKILVKCFPYFSLHPGGERAGK
ncbi:hypothetical protein POVCU1_030440 [Plasmodium ovale curtisi]|uniref:Uncharacterized protein n=1 Tax=Plasmodium ovale curtisi TaxID=864141 RepID=A0A1A8WXA5_PLAOA|nr:hypothetical protein POVCU1_030440 [Plasmodium ovale curtisi]